MATTNEFHSDIAFHPGETLAEKLEELKMGPKEFAVRTGKPEKTISAVLKGESSITPEMAVLFENVLKIPARFWLQKQFRFDEYQARLKRDEAIQEAEEWAKCFPYADMAKKEWVPATRKIKEKVEALFNFFELSSAKAWENYFYGQQLKVAFRISLFNTKEPHAVSAWIRQGEIQVSQIQSVDFSEEGFKASLPKIKSLMAKQPEDFFSQLQQICLKYGVKVVYTPSVNKAPLSGATRWVKDNPVIQLTGRYHQNDRFWFTFFHEAGHILLHGKKDIFLEDIIYNDLDKNKEEEADDFAIKWTFSKKEEEEVLASGRSIKARDIVYFARKFNTHPAMIIGRFQKKGIIPYSVGRQFFKKIELA